MQTGITLLLSLLFVGLVGCQSRPKYSWTSKDLIIDESTTLTTPLGVLSAEDIEKDKSFLIFALSEGYGGRKYIPDNKMQVAIKAIQGIKGPLTAGKFRDKIDEALLIIPDNHLIARINGSASKTRRKTYKQGMVGKNAISQRDKVWEVKQKRHDGQKYLYVSITHFPSHKDSRWNDFIPQVNKKMMGTSFAIIDLRGNGGGDDTMGFSLARVLNGKPVPAPMKKQYVSQTPETLAIFINNFKMQELRIRNQGKSVPSYLGELRGEIESEYSQAVAGILPPEKIKSKQFDQANGVNQSSNKNSKGYGKPIRILFDGNCASSCESTSYAFKVLPEVKTVGQNTAGFIHFGNIGFIVLPTSKIEVQIPTQYNEFYDGRFIERVGLKPDLYVPDNNDAMDFALDSLNP